MCIAILNKSGLIPQEHIVNSFENNYDGSGLAWIESGKINTYKTLDDIDTYISTYEKIRNANKLPILLHFRISTHGEVNIKNVHPFMIGNDITMVHNGIIDFPLLNPKYSDTHNFSRFLSNYSSLNSIFIPDSILSKYIESLCKKSSKMVFLNKYGKYRIFNEDLGHWNGESWYSNDTYTNHGLYDFGGSSGINCDSFYGRLDDLETFADLHSINPLKVDDYGVNWKNNEAWELDNWIKVQDYYYYKNTYKSLLRGL
jgi:hypothetical protein